MTARFAAFADEGRGVDALAALLALVLHATLVVATPRAPAVVREARLAEVELFEVETPPPRIETPEPLPAAAPSTPRIARAPDPERARPTTSAPPAVENAAPAPPDGPLDLSASVIAGNEGISFGGTGGGGGSSSRLTNSTPPSAPVPAERVARGASDLSEDVRPPSGLDRMLEAYFPSEARSQGITGYARVRLRVDANGRVVSATVTSESPPGSGFGPACRRMLLDAPSWSPALDPSGVPIARVGRDFRCQFDLR